MNIPDLADIFPKIEIERFSACAWLADDKLNAAGFNIFVGVNPRLAGWLNLKGEPTPAYLIHAQPGDVYRAKGVRN